MEKCENGYIIKLYKKLSSKSPHENLFHFTVFMNYDGLRVTPVKSFEEYNTKSLINFKDSPEAILEEQRNSFFERQKLCIYSIRDITRDIDIFNESPSLPLFVLVLVTYKDSENNNIKKTIEIIESMVHSSCSSGHKLLYNVFGTLSSHDLLIVLRSNCLDDCYKLVLELRINEYIRHTYSTYGYQGDYITQDQLCNLVSSQFFCSSIRINFESMDSYPTIRKKFIEQGYNISYTFGKFDINMEKYLNDIKDFFKFFCKDQILYWLSKGYYDGVGGVNSRLLYSISDKTDNAEINIFTPEKPKYKKINDNEFIKILNNIKEEEYVSPILFMQFKRLLLRFVQAENSQYQYSITRHQMEHFHSVVKCFAKLVDKFKADPIEQTSIMIGINMLNNLLDNQISDNNLDFEKPEANVRYSGNADKILICYQNYLQSIIKKYNSYNSDKKNAHYSIFVVAGINSKIQIYSLFNSSQNTGDYFFCVEIPIDLIYEVKFSIFLLTHELGHHMYKAGEEAKRNCVFINCFVKAFIALIQEKTTNKEYLKALEEELVDYISLHMTRETDLESGDKTYYNLDYVSDKILKLTTQYLYKIRESSINSLSDFDFVNILSKLRQETKQIKNAFIEVEADIFLISVFSSIDYLNVFKKYVEYSQIGDDIKKNIIYRILTIFMILLSPDKEMGVYESAQAIQKFFVENSTWLASTLAFPDFSVGYYIYKYYFVRHREMREIIKQRNGTVSLFDIVDDTNFHALINFIERYYRYKED